MANTSNRNQNVGVPINKHYPHDLSHRHITTMDFFRLQPIFCHDMIAGDTFNVDIRAIIQSAPLASQVFGGCHVDYHAFYVPNRLCWDEWEPYWLGDGREVDTQYSLPYITGAKMDALFGNTLDAANQPKNGSVFKERRRVFSSLGYPAYSSQVKYNQTGMRYSCMQARAYQKIWWDYYRDSVNIPEKDKGAYIITIGGDMSDTAWDESFQTRYRCYKKDYITTLLDSPQMGDASVAKGAYLGTDDGTELSVAAMRGANALQRYLERINVTGTRPMERLMALLGVKPTAERLDMAEFIGSYTEKINIDGLVNNGSSAMVTNANVRGLDNAFGLETTELGQGYQTGYAHARGQSDQWSYTAKEEGFFIVIASIVPEFSNPNSVQRQFIRGLSTPEASKFDWFTPDMDGLGYQEMLMAEVCNPSVSWKNQDLEIWSSDYDPFQVVGYQPKYEEYRFASDRISGDFLDNDSCVALRNMAFVRSYQDTHDPSELVAGLNLTTSTFADRTLFDRHFQVSNSSLDHFVCSFYFVNDAMRPVTNTQLPTELSDLSNSELLDVSNGGVRV